MRCRICIFLSLPGFPAATLHKKDSSTEAQHFNHQQIASSKNIVIQHLRINGSALKFIAADIAEETEFGV